MILPRVHGPRALLTLIVSGAAALSGLTLPATVAATPLPTADLSAGSPVAAPMPTHDSSVSAMPVSWTPQILNGRTLDVAQVGNTMVLGGSFTQVAPASGSPVLDRSSVVAFSALNGAISTGFAPAVTNGDVRAVEPGPVPGTVFLGGSFQGVNGVNRKIVLLDVDTGQLVPGFTAPPLNGAVNDLELVGNRLFVGGVFNRVGANPSGGLLSLDATTGSPDGFLGVALTENQNYTGQSGQAIAPVGAKSIAVRPQGDQMAVIGNFRKADGLERRQMVLIDLTGQTAAVRADWRTDRYAATCSSGSFDSYVRGVAASPDGSHFLVATTGGPHPGTLCDTLARWDVAATGTAIQPAWLNETGGDTLLSVTTSGAAVYTGGHQRWLNNLNGRDYANPGAVPRPGVGAVEVQTGIPLTWNPGRNPRGIGAESLVVTDAGLWVGSDTEQIGNWQFRRPRIAFFPLAGGTPLGAGETGSLPANVYRTDSSNALTRQWYEGATTTAPAQAAPSSDIDWSTVRGAVVIDDVLYHGTSSATLVRRSFDGTAFGPAEVIDPYNDAFWSTVDTGSGNTYRGVKPSFYSEISGLNGMAYDQGRLYYTRSGQSRLYSRAFSPESGVIGQAVTTVPGIDVTVRSGWFGRTADLGGVFFDKGAQNLYYVTLSNGNLNRIGWSDGATVGSATAVSGPAIDGTDWRSRALFIAGPHPEPNEPPAATIEVTCERLACAFDASASADADGTIESLLWDFGDGTTSTETAPSHTYAEGSFTVTLTVTDDDGDTGTATTELEVLANNPPQAAIAEPTCDLLACTFDGSGSTDVDAGDSIAGYSWDFGDGSPASTEAGPQHTYAEQGTFTVTLTVTDEDGATGSTSHELTVSDGSVPPPTPPELVGHDATNAYTTMPTVTVPADVQAGDLLVLFASTAADDVLPGPDGVGAWDEVTRVLSGPLAVSVYTRVADGSEAGQDVSVTLPRAYRSDLTISVHRGVAGDEFEVMESSVTANTDTHTSPTVTVPGDHRTALSFWADRSSTTTAWTAPAGVAVISSQTGSGTARVSSMLAREEVATGAYGGLVATTDATSARGVQLTILMAPAEPVTEPPVDPGPTDPEPTDPVPVPIAPALVGVQAANAVGSTSSVSLPAEIQAGDLLTLFVTTSDADTVDGPTGAGAWTQASRTTSGPLAVSVFTRVADGSESGQQVSVTLPRSTTRSDLTAVAHRGVGAAGVEVVESAADSNSATHTSPVVMVPGTLRTALTFWADRSSSTTQWTAPAGVETVSTQVGTVSARVGTLLVQQEATAGSYGALTATTDAPSARGITLTMLLAPMAAG